MEILLTLGGMAFVIFILIRIERKPPRRSPPRRNTTRPSATRPVIRQQPPRRPPRTAPTVDIPTPAGARFDADHARAATPPRVISGRAYVVDGDTIRVQKTQIRLFGIDAPEMNHPYGVKAKWAMVNLCKGQTITAEITAEDDYGRTVAKCYLPDGRDLSAEMVKQGMAIDWPKYSGGIYYAMETPDARKKLWLADARQKGRMHVWERFEARERAKAGN